MSRYPRDRTYLVIFPNFGVIGVSAPNKKEAKAKILRAFKRERLPRGTVIARGSIHGPVIE